MLRRQSTIAHHESEELAFKVVEQPESLASSRFEVLATRLWLRREMAGDLVIGAHQ